jgi:beta-N-acetylhexosaminidase
MRRRLLVPLVALAGVLSACSTSGSGSTPSTPAPPPPTTTGSTAPSSPPSTTGTGASPSPTPTSKAEVALAMMSLPQRVGQLLMVDCPSTGVADATVTAITKYHVGSVILDGNSTLGVEATGEVVAKLQDLITRGPKLFVATDQEGGLVQRLRGSGFSDIPSAVEQGKQDPGQLTTATTVWAGQLRAAGVNVDLAPVLDTVPSSFGSNPPIGDLDRNYGNDPDVVTAHGLAVAKGLAAAGIEATAKHFPGLGRVSANTDTDRGVRDTITTADDPYLAPFAAAVKAHVPFVMMSTAIYTQLDPKTPAAFSKPIVTGLLRDKLGFDGVVISDDLGAAEQVAHYKVGDRAVDFVAAGGDLVLTVDAGQAAEMTAALIAKAKADPAFRALVDAAALRVLTAKQQTDLIP